MKKLNMEFRDAARLVGLGRLRWNEGGEGDGGEGDGKAGTEGNAAVTKADFDALQEKYTSAQQEIERVRGEILSDDYLDFIQAKEKGEKGDKGEEAKTGVKETILPDDFEKMSKKEIYDAAVKAAKESYQADFGSLKSGLESKEKAATKMEIDRFAKTHPDFEQFKPVMYGLSAKKDNVDKSLQELYDLSKEYVKALPGTTMEDKKKQAAMWGERPGGASGSIKTKDKVSDVDATNDAVKETVEQLGTIPSF